MNHGLDNRESHITGCDCVQQERKQEMSAATLFHLYFTFPVSAHPLLAAGCHGYRQAASFFCLEK